LGRSHSFDYEAMRSAAEQEEGQAVDGMEKMEAVQMEYFPVYILGNVCLGTSILSFDIALIMLINK